MNKLQILWVDDEIDLLRAHVVFLEAKGYQLQTANNGDDALSLIEKSRFDLVFLDENMPGKSGLETLVEIKNKYPSIPVVMVTKSEEENLMDDAIGSKISDYLIKPVNPNQILLSIKKNIDKKRLVSEKTTSEYLKEFQSIGMALHHNMTFEEWISVYKKLVFWELELSKSGNDGMEEIIASQKSEANHLFSKFVQENYLDWINKTADFSPIMSHSLFKNKIYPELQGQNQCVFLFVIDNLRYDQWKIIQPILSEYFEVISDELYCSLLPTATQYCRNSLFAGLLPLEIEKTFPGLWLNDSDEGGKNMHEDTFLTEQLKRLGIKGSHSYTKITNLANGKRLVENIPNQFSNNLNVIVYNFVDMLSHARTEMEVIKELAPNEKAYRSITESWIEHSPLLGALQRVSEISKSQPEKKVRIIITTDHGSVRVKEASKLVGDKNTSSNLRYKHGKSLSYSGKDVFDIGNPEKAGLPKSNLSSRYVFAKEDKYFVYPNNYNYYVNFFKNSFQHGGISMEEMLIPFVTLRNR